LTGRRVKGRIEIMSNGLLFIFIWVTAVMVGVLFIVQLLGVPPKHCQYMVKVKNHPGVYSCSQYPRAVSVNK
jgi:hypothetical protein